MTRTIDVITILFIGYILYHFFPIWMDSQVAGGKYFDTRDVKGTA